MSDEIKEILDKWKCYIGLTKKFTTNEYEMLRVEDIDKLLDYITNLQQEKDNLYLDNTMLKMEKDIYKQGYEELKELIEKTIMGVNNE